MHKLTELQGNTNRNATHTHNGAYNSHTPPCHRCGESTVLQNFISKLNNAMCVVRLATFQGCAVRDYRILLYRGCGHATNLVENQATEPKISPNNKDTFFQLSHKQLHQCTLVNSTDYQWYTSGNGDRYWSFSLPYQ